MASFEQDGLSFHLDRVGVTLPTSREIQLDVDYDDLAIDPDRAADELGRRLSALTGEAVMDEEGLFDFAVYRGETLLAALVLSCEDDELSLGGERAETIDDEDLARAVVGALTSSRARA